MRFEELAYTVDGLPVTVGFHARLTVVSLPAADERAYWVAGLLGVLEGTRDGDGAGLVYVDRAGRRIRLERDEQGGALLRDAATGEELPYSAAHLSLDGRFDWFASVGLTARRAADAMVVGADTLAADTDHRPTDPGEQPMEAGRVPALAATWREAAERRDALVSRLDGDETVLRQLVDEVEPALVDALLAFAEACKPFDVVVDAARLEAAGVGAAGVAALTEAVLAEVAARTASVEAEARLSATSGAERILRRRAERARRVGRCKEPLPLIVDDALSPFPAGDKATLLEAVADAARTTQVVYLSGDPETLAWASDRAATGTIGLWQPDGVPTVA